MLINNTSLGRPAIRRTSSTSKRLKRSAIVYDVVYVPLETELLKPPRPRAIAWSTA